ncbi:non-ribosomal peptide synthetase [Lactobacillus delbrueckii subsp. lactis]|uniref:non-ribosomal peptide synthetase n=1 Tax=Lactobacillus delbrueckii TaxID=1584 RepID=UPI0027FEB8F8|nr:non-ribosomal peptide synthetase [Lactobacillus delbrueckii]MDQ7161003.1 non-ribosomal peptide synthetase [Lactobacillus delbrueckii subsp. lactis]MDQ7163543.1 non-ribosomal peptide synthetase [Lactobacillus delbrueckii subsp. lactis]MDQ7177532.1 non-ribosomal peptide synthetase [Lactobacillus delbrueckii subsp. lactis]MDQ7205836.1 non-ribosomal peptide synthetase [Lactobacillus delbrueckii subsp. lactis]
MNKLDLVRQYLDSEKITGTKIFYGSCIESHSDAKDVDVCVITNQTVDEDFYHRYKKFLIENNIVIDEEVRYEDKLLLSESKISNAIKNYVNKPECFDLEADYPQVVDRLVVNILTTKVKVFDDNGVYDEYSNQAWEEVLKKFTSLGGNTFSDFTKLFQINQNYKSFWGYSPKVVDDLFNRFYRYHSSNRAIRLLKENVIKHPQRIAVFSENRNLTYEELDKLSDNIANKLLEFNSDYVVVNYPHTYELLPIVYGILKAGKIYIPVDNTSPLTEIEPIRKKFKDSIYISENASDLAVSKALGMEHRLLDYSEIELAYIIHTSGTTGVPKGVCVTKNNLNYILEACQYIAPVSSRDCYLFSTRDTFDVSITEIFGFLYNGGSVCVYSAKNKDFYKEFPDLIEKFGITHVALSPSVLGLLLKLADQEDLRKIDKLKYLLVAGEEFKYELLKLVLKDLKKVNVYNVYGPTETTVYATYFNVRNTPKKLQKVPIGENLPGVKTMLVKDELLIGGKGVSAGYFNNAEQTDQKFEKIDGEVFYHTGDIVEKQDSLLVYRDRKDSQVQIHGIRVELGDIRANISNIIDDPTRDIEVVFYSDSLILFYTGTKISDLRTMLEKHMVSYKIPSKYINVKGFPLTSSGKVDRKKLLSGMKESSISSNDSKKSGIGIYNTVKHIAESVMNQTVGSEENLLDIGLDSLRSVELVLELEKRLNIDLSAFNIYMSPTVDKIASFIENMTTSPASKADKELFRENEIKNIPITRKVEYTYPAFFYARIYNSLGFNSQLTGKIYLGKDSISYEEIYHKLSKVEVFKSVLSEDLNTFKVLDTPVNISKYEVADARIDISKTLSDLVKTSIENGGLLYKFVLLEDENESVLHYSIDHSICDSSSLDALERYILGIYDSSQTYSSYIEEVYSRNHLEEILKEMAKFEQQDDRKVAETFKRLEDRVNFVSLTYLNNDTKNVYAEILLYLRDKLLNKFALNNVKVNLIYNIRKFQEKLDFTTTIGDLHLGLTYSLTTDDDIDEQLTETIAFYQKNMFNPKAVGYKHFPNLNSDEERIVRCFDDTVYVSIDYLGVVSRKEFNTIKQSAIETNTEIKKLNGSKLNITAYIVDNRLELIMSKALD